MSAFDDVCRVVREECGIAAADRVSMRLRELFGTQRIYIPGKAPPDVKRTDTVQTLRARHSVSRATAYNWLNKYKL